MVPDGCAGLRFDAALAKMFPAHSRSRLQGWIKAGRFVVDGEIAEVRRKEILVRDLRGLRQML